MTNRLEDETQRNVESVNNQENQESETHTPQEGIQDIYVLIVREHEEEEEHTQVVDSAPVKHRKDSMAFLPVCVFLLLIFSTLAFQLYCMFNPPVEAITIIPKSHTINMTGRLQLGRVLQPLTISQSQTTATTGKGHQSAKTATGYITFYNGQFQNVTIATGAILTGASGIQVVTDQDTTIPAANPPIFGQVSVSAHAINQGVLGNLPAYDINQACCATSVLAKNTQPFTGGQDERDFSTVSQQDINKLSTPLKTAVTQGMQAALQGQVKPVEQLQLLPCTPTVTSDHGTGQEARQVKVTVSQTCNAVAYNNLELQTKAATLLSHQAATKPGTGYSLIGNVQVSVKEASVTSTTIPHVFLSFKAQGTWVYGISQKAQQQIKHLIAGKTTQQAEQLVASLPGVEHAAIQFTGFGDATRLPKTAGYIHIILIVV